MPDATTISSIRCCKRTTIGSKPSLRPIEPRYDIPSDATSLEARREKLEAWLECGEPVRTELEQLERETRMKVVEAAIEKFPPDVRPALRKAQAEREPEERSIAVLAYLQIANELKGLDFSKKLKGQELAQWKYWKKHEEELKKGMPKEPEMSLTVRDIGSRAPKVTIVGRASAGEVHPEAPSVLGDRYPLEVQSQGESTGRRLALARWITDPSNPLAWRVIVNRLWQHHFGRGLVANASDFGRLGEPPTHPELLDFLAQQMIEQGGGSSPCTGSW